MERKNSFDFVRFCAASGVLIGHQFIITGVPNPWGIADQDIAEIPLHVFFVLSGFLIYQSLERSTNLASFVSARITRIGPTLIVALCAASLATLLWFHNWPQAVDHLKYVYRNVFFPFRVISDEIPGVFESIPRHTINSPLWTLAYEVWCYALLYVIFRLGRYRLAAIIVALIVLNVAWVSFGVNDARLPGTPIFPMRIGRLGCYFFSGSIVAAAWPVLKRRAMLAGALSLALFIVVVFEAPHTVICSLLLAGVVIGLGSSPLFSGFSKLGDASYGIYVFAWPIQQFSVLLVSGLWPSLLLAYCMTAAAGYTTWHLYEKRAIAARKTLAALIRQPLVYGAVRGPRRIERTTFDAS